jgi:hypothetical protein
MGMVHEAFDREFLRLLGQDDDAALLEYANGHVNEAGNGTEEIRTWLIARGIAGPASLDVITYRALPDWYIGVSLVEWRTAQAAASGVERATA